jgi:hypothetical protein
MVSLSIYLKAEKGADYASWKNLSDKDFSDSLKKMLPPLAYLEPVEYIKKFKGPLLPLSNTGLNVPKVSDSQVKVQFQGYVEFLNDLDLVGIDPYRMYYNRINIKKINEFKKNGFDLLRIYGGQYLSDNGDKNSLDYSIFNNQAILIAKCTKIIEVDDLNDKKVFEVTEVLKDNYKFYKKGDILTSGSSTKHDKKIEIYRTSLGASSEDIAYFNQKRVKVNSICLIYIDRYEIDQYLENNSEKSDMYKPFTISQFETIVSNYLRRERSITIAEFVNRIELFEKINETVKFYDIEFK